MHKPYAAPIIVVARKSKPGAPLAETKRLVIDDRESNKQIPKLQTTQLKSKGSLVLIETAKIDHIWSKLGGTKYFSVLVRPMSKRFRVHKTGYYHQPHSDLP